MAGGLTQFNIDTVQISTDAQATWQTLPALNAISKSGGDGSSSNVETLTGSAQSTTAPGVATYNLTFPVIVASHPAILACVNAANANTELSIRFVSNGTVILAKDSKGTPTNYLTAIANTGVFTLAGADSPSLSDQLYNEGLIVKYGSSNTVTTIGSITGAKTFVGTPAPATDVTGTATTYSIERPSLTETATGRFQSAGNWDFTFGSATSATMIFAPNARAFFTIT